MMPDYIESDEKPSGASIARKLSAPATNSLPRAIDFQRLIYDMQRMDHTAASLALHSNVPRTSIRNYVMGAEPGHSAGERLLLLWTQIMSKTRDDAPRMTCRERHDSE